MPVKVLIVDDSKLARIVVAKALAQLRPDWEKVEASSAAQALEIIQAGGIDVAFIDFNMTVKDGLELAGEIREILPDLPIAIITANIQDEVVARAREVGAAFIAKPVTTEGISGFVSATALKLRPAKA